MKIKRIEELERFDIICADDNKYMIVLDVTDEYAMISPYYITKDLIDIEKFYILSIKGNQDIVFNVYKNCVEKVDKNHFKVNGVDIKIK